MQLIKGEGLPPGSAKPSQTTPVWSFQLSGICLKGSEDCVRDWKASAAMSSLLVHTVPPSAFCRRSPAKSCGFSITT